MSVEDDWVEVVSKKIKKGNQILFSRESACLQELLAAMREQKHRTLVLWALRSVEKPLETLRQHYPQEERPRIAVELCKQWAEGEVKMPIAKKALLEAHQVAKEIESLADKALCHAVGQACAVVHVETHAIGLPVYELTALVREFGVDQCRKPVETRISEYLSCLKLCEKEVDTIGLQWADFLLDDSRPNKEKLIVEHSIK